MTSAAKKLIDYAKSQLGVSEDPLGSNRQKYGAMLDKIPWYLYREGGKEWIHQVNGHDWCTQFVDSCFITVFDIDTAREMLNRPKYNNYGAGVSYAYDYFNSCGRAFRRGEKEPIPGDVIYFRNDRGLSHTGIVIEVTATTVSTMEGNAGENNYYVARYEYNKENSRIYGYGSPNYEIAEKYPPVPFKAVNTLKGVSIRNIPYSDGAIIGTIKQGSEIMVESMEGSSGDFAKITGYVYLPGGFKWED